ncbi:MAG TPA: chorismate-binding protein [Chloroflexi bacterium]|nr:chorismate-binding protein [Chloroflexota bacterium]
MIAIPASEQITSLDALSKQNFSGALSAFYRAAVETKLPVALWRAPNSAQKHALVAFAEKVSPLRIDFTHQVPGFAFSPFVNEGGQGTLFIKADLHLSQQGHHFYNSLQRNGNGNQKTAYKQPEFLAAYQALRQSDTLTSTTLSTGTSTAFSINSPKTWPVGQSPIANKMPADETARKQFCTLVSDAISYIQTTGIKKIVASRVAETVLPPDFSPVAAFEALCRRYPRAFVSLVSIPNVGTWIGASPEPLLRLQPHQLQTVALAGTQAFNPDKPLNETVWGDKELEEQALVSDYIREFFQQLELRQFTEDGPHTVSAGNVVHLQTDFKVEMESPRLLALANQVLHSLHPTSAVCGMPKQEALSFILEKESYNRAFYSGFLGPLHLQDQSNLFVNLRCMQLQNTDALLYVGAGITQDSVPCAEWEETVLKSKTLLSVLENERIANGEFANDKTSNSG